MAAIAGCVVMCSYSLSHCPTLCDPLDWSPPGSSVHGDCPGKTAGALAVSFSRGSSQPRDHTHVSHIACMGRWILYYCLTSEAPHIFNNCVWLWRRQWHPTPVPLPGNSHGWRSLVGCSPWGRKESGMTERLHFHFSLSCIGEGNGNPLQCSCLENPRDGGAWWAAVYGVTESWTRLKRLSSSSSMYKILIFMMLNL